MNKQSHFSPTSLALGSKAGLARPKCQRKPSLAIFGTNDPPLPMTCSYMASDFMKPWKQ